MMTRPATCLAALLLAAMSSLPGLSEAVRRHPSYPVARNDPCPLDSLTYELVTGYVFASPADMMDSHPDTLMLSDCMELCRQNTTCRAANYETGYCVLFSSDADKNPDFLTTSQDPVFTMYLQKTCLRDAKPCDRGWSFERVSGFQLVGFARKKKRVTSRSACMEMCLVERDFVCRSANFHKNNSECEISDMDRHTVSGSRSFRPANNSDYLESNCVDDPVRLCDFHKMEGRILKTVDSVYQDVATLEDCRELCLRAPYRCHSFDYNDTSTLVCRLSHHSSATLNHVIEPYLTLPHAATYELGACYNVSIDCRAGDMVARIRTSKLFNGKVYAKGSPNSCVEDVAQGLEFELYMAYNDIECGVRREGLGRYANDIVIQHHDQIVTSSDLGLAVSCQYDLSNKSVANEIDLNVIGDVKSALTEEAVVDSPNVAMKIVDNLRQDIRTAQVGDPLVLRFEIADRNSPYEIFVRELVAMDGVDSSEILLIDVDGCPTDHRILSVLDKPEDEPKSLEANFDAFKFPTSEIVQFRALVTPCLPSCPPVNCDLVEPNGLLRQVESFGRRRRRHTDATSNHTSPTEEVLVVQSIQISDKFKFQQQRDQRRNDDESDVSEEILSTSAGRAKCVNVLVLVATGAAFLAAQVAILATWAFLWQRRRGTKGADGAGSTRFPNTFSQKHF